MGFWVLGRNASMRRFRLGKTKGSRARQSGSASSGRACVNFIDTADSYGPETNESLISQALYPYPSGLVIATKVAWCDQTADLGPRRSPRPFAARDWRQLTALAARAHRFVSIPCAWPQCAIIESVGALADLQRLGKIRHIGISNVTIAAARGGALHHNQSCPFRTCTICEAEPAKTYSPRASVLELLFCPGIPWVADAA